MSAFAAKGKAYGLIMPSGKKTTTAKPVARPSVFGDSSSDEEDDGRKHVNASLKKAHEKTKKQMDEAASHALAEDPSIFEYDSLYDQMVEDKKKKCQKLSSERKPKYIHALKKAAERRKLEGELVYEHLAQKEIEKDAEQFKDKESFVTSAYKKKLVERRKLEEELAREAVIEEVNDVTKQKDLSRFQKHLFNQVASPGVVTESEKKEPQPLESKETEREGRESGESSSKKRETSEGGGSRDEHRERRLSSGTEKRGGSGRERRPSSSEGSRHRERQRTDSNRERSDREEREGRHSSDRERHHRERHSERHRERRDSQGQERAPEHPSTDDKPADRETEEPPRKKMTVRAGIEVEEEEMTPGERRRLAAAKKATEETTMSAKERYLIRKRAKAKTEGRKPSTSDE